MLTGGTDAAQHGAFGLNDLSIVFGAVGAAGWHIANSIAVVRQRPRLSRLLPLRSHPNQASLKDWSRPLIGAD
jgi:hypothetical protein